MRTAILTVLADVCYLSALYILFLLLPHKEIELSTLINQNLYFLLFALTFLSLKYTIANKVIIRIFVTAYFFYSTLPIFVYFAGDDLGFLENRKGLVGDNFDNVYWIFLYTFLTTYNLFIAVFLFLKYVLIRKAKNIKLLFAAAAISLGIGLFFYSPVLFYDNLMIIEEYAPVYHETFSAAYYLNILSLAFIVIFWIYYNQGYFVMSDYIPSILSLFTLVIMLEIFHCFSFLYAYDLYANGLFFTALINSGLIMLWAIRIIYLVSDEASENENYVLNYDLLQGFVEKPRLNNLNRIILKYGRRNLIIFSVVLLIIVAVPLLNYKPDNVFIKFNILILILSLFVSIIYTLVYIQKRWYNIIGFIFKNRLK